MFISDLSYLETTVATEIVGGRRRRHRRGGKVDIDITNIRQVAVAKSSAKAYKGNANSKAVAVNVAIVD